MLVTSLTPVHTISVLFMDLMMIDDEAMLLAADEDVCHQMSTLSDTI
jgi:hypothetical protein